MSHRTLNNRKRDPLGNVRKPRPNQCATAGKPSLSSLQGIVYHAPCVTCIQRLIAALYKKKIQ